MMCMPAFSPQSDVLPHVKVMVVLHLNEFVVTLLKSPSKCFWQLGKNDLSGRKKVTFGVGN